VIVVLGGTGFVGAHTAMALAARGHEVVATRRGTGPVPRVLAPGVADGAVRIAQVELTDAAAVERLFAEERPDSVVDLSGHAPKELDPATDVRERTAMLTAVLEGVRACGVPRLTVTSSTDVYWCLPPEEIPYTEDARVVLQESADNFLTQAWAKKLLEIVSGMLARAYGTELLTVRLGGVYGPGYGTYLSLISRLARAAVLGEEPDYARERGGIPVAEAGYDLSYAADIADGIATVHLAPHPARPVYNIGAGRAVTHGEVTRAVEEAVPGFTGRLRSRPDAVARRPNPWMSTERIRTEFGWAPRHPLAEGVRAYVAHLCEELR